MGFCYDLRESSQFIVGEVEILQTWKFLIFFAHRFYLPDFVAMQIQFDETRKSGDRAIDLFDMIVTRIEVSEVIESFEFLVDFVNFIEPYFDDLKLVAGGECGHGDAVAIGEVYFPEFFHFFE